MPEVECRLKPEPAVCVCGCGLVGPLRAKQWKDGLGPHVKGCRCRRCQGARNRKGGLGRQAKVRDAFRIMGGSDEERWASVFQNEVKSGKQVGPAWTAFLKAEAQAVASNPDFGSQRKPVRVFLEPSGTSDGVVMVRKSVWRDFISPALDEFYGEG